MFKCKVYNVSLYTVKYRPLIIGRVCFVQFGKYMTAHSTVYCTGYSTVNSPLCRTLCNTQYRRCTLYSKTQKTLQCTIQCATIWQISMKRLSGPLMAPSSWPPGYNTLYIAYTVNCTYTVVNVHRTLSPALYSVSCRGDYSLSFSWAV